MTFKESFEGQSNDMKPDTNQTQGPYSLQFAACLLLHICIP